MRQLFFIYATSIFTLFAVNIQAENRWAIQSDGSISWVIDNRVPHSDHIEMSGQQVSTVLRYGVAADSSFHCERSIVWPMLRTIPNDTHASLTRRFAWNIPDMLSVNGRSLTQEKVRKITLKGVMIVESDFLFSRNRKLTLTRTLFPSVKNPAFYEKYTLQNTGESAISVEIPSSASTLITDKEKGVSGSYSLVGRLEGQTYRQLAPGEKVSFHVTFAGYRNGEPEIAFNIENELKEREDLVAQLWQNLILETPEPVVQTLFNFAKIRGSESIYKTKGGFMHGPGGEAYYAALWANDQAEYINPFFPFLGYSVGNESALNSFKHFARFINPEYKRIPSSIIAEGIDIWDGAGDRGDAAMVAYGAARYALSSGSKEEAEELWPLIEWCLEYCKRNLNDKGVVASDSDELENRFPSGDANLCTSSLYYDALRSAVYLGKNLKKPASQLAAYAKEATTLRKNIESYFGATVEGFDTYRYYDGNDILRSWICIPLTVGIYDRKEATIQALFSPRLWTDNGLLTQAGTETFWDRSTLYALRGVYASGETEKATDYLKRYSAQRLLGEHVPYPIEAWPEGSQRHLSAESGLYCRIITEGLFGIRPTGLHSFALTPHLPKDWNHMNLRHIKAFNSNFDIEVSRNGDRLDVTVAKDGKKIVNKMIKEGSTVSVQL